MNYEKDMKLIFWLLILVVFSTLIYFNVFKEEQVVLKCSDGFKLQDGICYKEELVDDTKKVCVLGKLEGDKCVIKEVSDLLPQCPFSYTREGNNCIYKVQTKKIETIKCPTGYNNTLDEKRCLKEINDVECAFPKRKINNKCYDEKAADISDNCASWGGISKGEVCEKTVSKPLQYGCSREFQLVDNECVRFKTTEPEIVKKCVGENLIKKNNKCFKIIKEEPHE